MVAYKSEAVGRAQMIDNDFRFNRVEIHPIIVISDNTDLLKAKSAIKNAHKQCLISKALNIEVKINPTIRMRRVD